MADSNKFFSDGAAYETAMGRCSRVAGKLFLEWLSLPDGLKWLDVGCGTGSFTELVLHRNAPSAISAVDPSEGQIEFARGKPWAGAVDFREGDAMSLPFSDATFDVAVMALVIQYIPDPSKAMSEITRVVRPGGTVATYTWPGSHEAHPMQPLSEAADAIGVVRPRRPGNQIRTIDGQLTHLLSYSIRLVLKTSTVVRSNSLSFTKTSMIIGPPKVHLSFGT
jgi:SAM-dependent methyltransferase